MSDSCTCDTCVICFEAVVGSARVTTECGHVFHPRCIFDNIAKNTGNEEGSTRNLCPMCRTPLCDEVQPDTRFTMRLADAIYEEGQAVLVYRDLYEVTESQRAEKVELIRQHREEVKMLMDQLDYSVGEIQRISWVSEKRLEKVHCMKHALFVSKLAPGYELRATVKLQNWFHSLKRAKLEKHRDAWKIYKAGRPPLPVRRRLTFVDVVLNRYVDTFDIMQCWDIPDAPLSSGEEAYAEFNVEDLD